MLKWQFRSLVSVGRRAVGQLDPPKTLEPADKSERRRAAATNPAPPLSQKGVHSIVLGDVDHQQCRWHADKCLPTVPRLQRPVDRTPQTSKTVTKTAPNSGNEHSQRVPSLLPGGERDAGIRVTVEISQPCCAHATPIPCNYSCQGGQPLRSWLPALLLANERHVEIVDKGRHVREALEAFKEARGRLLRHVIESRLETSLRVSLGLAPRTSREVRKYAFTYTVAKLAIHQGGHTLSEVVCPQSRRTVLIMLRHAAPPAGRKPNRARRALRASSASSAWARPAPVNS